MDRFEDIKRRLHNVKGAISVFDTFVRHVDPKLLSDDMQALQQAVLRKLDSVKIDLPATQDAIHQFSQE